MYVTTLTALLHFVNNLKEDLLEPARVLGLKKEASVGCGERLRVQNSVAFSVAP